MEGIMKSLIVKRSIVIAGHKTSVSLEDPFWRGLKEIARGRDLTLSEMVAAVDSRRNQANLSSTLRLFVLDHYRAHISKEANGQRLPHLGIGHNGVDTLAVWAEDSFQKTRALEIFLTDDQQTKATSPKCRPREFMAPAA
jgi:predicted DNA-binding ribbon-helix-helix protein